METLISFSLAAPRRLLWHMRARLSQVLVLIAWRFWLNSRRYIMLRDLVLETRDGSVKLGLVVLSTRGVFVVETWNTNIAVAEGCANRFERGCNTMSCYDNLVHHCDERARLVARALEEDRCFVRPVVVLPGPRVLPKERPSNVVSDFGLIQYIRSFKFHVYSSRQIQEIASHLVQPQSPPPRRAAA
jgi:hypothetical protein